MASTRLGKGSLKVLSILLVLSLILAVGSAALLPPSPEGTLADGGDFTLDFTASGPFTYNLSTGGGALKDRTIDKYFGVVATACRLSK